MSEETLLIKEMNSIFHLQQPNGSELSGAGSFHQFNFRPSSGDRFSEWLASDTVLSTALG
jgi:hypothetical protein